MTILEAAERAELVRVQRDRFRLCETKQSRADDDGDDIGNDENDNDDTDNGTGDYYA